MLCEGMGMDCVMWECGGLSLLVSLPLSGGCASVFASWAGYQVRQGLTGITYTLWVRMLSFRELPVAHAPSAYRQRC